ncbi:MAG: DUF3299 domain-containing protein [Pirellulales bacterium]
MIRKRLNGRSATSLFLAIGLALSTGCDQSATSTPIAGDQASTGTTAPQEADPTPPTETPARATDTPPALSAARAPDADRRAFPSDPAETDAVARTARQASRTKQPTGPIECTFDDVKFEIEKDGPFDRSMLTPKITQLVGKQIRIRGYILPSFQQTGLTQFVLVRDNMECCFGPGAALYDCILVEMEPGRSTEFSIRPVAVDGQFSIRELVGPGGKHLAIYHLRGEAVRH